METIAGNASKLNKIIEYPNHEYHINNLIMLAEGITTSILVFCIIIYYLYQVQDIAY